jgi:hypothetical protein
MTQLELNEMNATFTQSYYIVYPLVLLFLLAFHAWIDDFKNYTFFKFLNQFTFIIVVFHLLHLIIYARYWISIHVTIN